MLKSNFLILFLLTTKTRVNGVFFKMNIVTIKALKTLKFYSVIVFI